MSTTSQTPDPLTHAAPAWTGWCRPRGKRAWQRVVSAESEAAAWELLLIRAPAGCDLLVTPRGDTPLWT